MATTSTDPREIEADLERERASLATTLDALSDRVSVDNLAKEALGVLKGHAGSATSTIDHAVRANPLAVALIGAGVAWMFLGPKVRSSSSSRSSSPYSSGYGSSVNEAYTGSPPSSYGSSAYGSSSYATSGSADYGRVGYVASDNDDDHAWSHEAHGLRARAAEALRRIEHEAKSYYDSLRDGISSMTSGSAQDRDFDSERESVISGFASDLKARFAAGLDNLPPEARDRVIAARERAYAAMIQAERTGRDMWNDPSRAMEEHPFVMAAVAFGLGAAAGAAIPSTDYENRTFGAERDRLMDEASRLLREERGRAVEVAGSLGSSITQELKSAAQETVSAVGETVTSKAQETVQAVKGTVTDKAQEAAHRVGDRASEEISHAQGGSSSGTSNSGTANSGQVTGSKKPGGPGDPVIR